MDITELNFPLTDSSVLKDLRLNQTVYISGIVYTARDAAHKKLVEMLRRSEDPPFCFNGAAVFYAGPCPARPGSACGSIGPTTSGRMDAYSPFLIERGLRFMIGKGGRNKEVADAIERHGGLYLSAIGGAAALTAKCVERSEIVAFPELGTEAVRKLWVRNILAVVTIS